MSAAWPVDAARGLDDDRRVGGADHRHHQLRVDRAAAEVVVPVLAGVEGVLGVVGVDQVDPAGDRLDPVDQAEQVLAAGVGVAGVQAEADLVVAERVPEPGQRVEPAGAGVVAAGGVLDQDRQRRSRRTSAAYAKVLRQLSKPTARSSPALTWPPCTIRPLAPTAAAAVAWPSSSLRLGMRIRLLSVATLMTYGAWT